MNTPAIPEDTLWRRGRRSLLIAAALLLIAAPPLVFTPLQRVYAPVYDTVVLWIAGHVWHRFYPVSAIVLLPAGALGLGLWLAWLCRFRPINPLQRTVTAMTIRWFPDHGPYIRLKRRHLSCIAWINRFPASFRTRYPLSRMPRQYGIEAISGYYLTVAEGLLARWTGACWSEPDGGRAEALRRRIVAAHEGLARVYVPDASRTADIDALNIGMAMIHLDDAQMFGAHHGPRIRDLFLRYLKKCGISDDAPWLLSLSRLQRILDEGDAFQRVVTLRMLINLWFETGHPSISAVVTGFVSRHLEETHRLFARVVDTRGRAFDEASAPEPAVEPLDMRLLHRRYAHFVEQARGYACAIQTRTVMEALSRMAGHILRLSPRAWPQTSGAHAPSVYFERVQALAAPFEHLLSSADYQQQALAWSAARRRLRRLYPTVSRALWTAMYRAGHPEALVCAHEQGGPENG